MEKRCQKPCRIVQTAVQRDRSKGEPQAYVVLYVGVLSGARPTRAGVRLTSSTPSARLIIAYCVHSPRRRCLPHSLSVRATGLSYTARVQRGPSQAARCASTGDQQAPSPFLLREQRKLLTPSRHTLSGRELRKHALLPSFPLSEGDRTVLSARIGRAQFHRARSASKKDSRLPSPYPLCASM